MHLGVIAPESHSHVAALTHVGAELAKLGHRVTYLGFEDVRKTPEEAGLGFATIAPKEFPRGSVDRMMKEHKDKILKNSSKAQKNEIENGLKRILEDSQMGELFKVIIVSSKKLKYYEE